MAFTDELHAELTKVEKDIEDFFKRYEGTASEDAKTALTDVKSDVAEVRKQVDEEAPAVAEDASTALKTAVGDLTAKAITIIQDPKNLPKDLEDVAKEVEQQDKGEITQVENTVKTDVSTDESTIGTQVHDLVSPSAPAPAASATDSETDTGSQAQTTATEDRTDGDQQDTVQATDQPHPAEADVNAANAGPATIEPQPAVEATPQVDDNPKEGTIDHEIKAILDNNEKIAEESKNVPEPAEGAETPESFANRVPDSRQNVAGGVQQV
jgi:hypothetical protein